MHPDLCLTLLGPDAELTASFNLLLSWGLEEFDNVIDCDDDGLSDCFVELTFEGPVMITVELFLTVVDEVLQAVFNVVYLREHRLEYMLFLALLFVQACSTADLVLQVVHFILRLRFAINTV